MQHPVWTFLRLVWSEWASRVTGSLSAILVLLGLGISLAGAFGVQVPAASIIQLATWFLAAACGGQAAYAVWAKEREARNVAEQKLRHAYGLSLEAGTSLDKINRENTLKIRLTIRNTTQIVLSWTLESLEIEFIGIKIIKQTSDVAFILHPGNTMTWFPAEGLSHSQYEDLPRESQGRVRYRISYGLADEQPDRQAEGEIMVDILKVADNGVDCHWRIQSQSDQAISIS